MARRFQIEIDRVSLRGNYGSPSEAARWERALIAEIERRLRKPESPHPNPLLPRHLLGLELAAIEVVRAIQAHAGSPDGE